MSAPMPQSPQQKAEELARAVDELLARDVDAAEEAEVLEQAQRIVNEALGTGGQGA
ncbi:MAG TPA: hypothetical protein H9867_04255 [Candidatus Corynebacterium gallistercoris]|uniref:Uncharacterized protein n=1 Tax=Candidatus Corynebacterium gallistercoris TaxID=2838530 RepID=A0A9D1RZR9_9CORY|nr:hypothetical protein [Candidatus Corynebacterium gallistercoris]